MKDLVITADDGGLDPATDAAILRCARAGMVAAVSVVAHGPCAEACIEAALDLGIEVGLHLNLTQALPSHGPSRKERFSGKADVWRRGLQGSLLESAVREELEAQVAWMRAHVGPFTFVNGHNHVQILPSVLAVLREVLPGCWVRVPLDLCCADDAFPESLPGLRELARRASVPPLRHLSFVGFAFSRRPDLETLADALDRVTFPAELMVHPGCRPGSRFTTSLLRDAETALLTSPALRTMLLERGIRVTRFGELP